MIVGFCIICTYRECQCFSIVGRIIYRKHFKHKLRKEGIDLSTFDFLIIARATENFAESNKLGEGGFGPVYKVIWKTNYRCLFS